MRSTRSGLASVPALIVATTITMCAVVLTLAMINYKKAAELKLEYKQKIAILKLNASSIHDRIKASSEAGMCIFKLEVDGREVEIKLRRGQYKIAHGVALYCTESGEPRIVEPGE